MTNFIGESKNAVFYVTSKSDAIRADRIYICETKSIMTLEDLLIFEKFNPKFIHRHSVIEIFGRRERHEQKLS